MTVADARQLHDCRRIYAATLAELATADPRVVAVVNDSVGSSNLVGFKERFPDRTVNVGIAEQDMVGVAAGLANGGRIPVVSSAACFLTARAMEQIKVDAAYSRHHLVLCGMSPGVAYGELGPTHHSIEDVAWTRVIPGMTVIVPCDPSQTAEALRWAVTGQTGPVYIRVPRMPIPDITPEGAFVPGRAIELAPGDDVTIIANGTVANRALTAAELLAARGVGARVLAMPFVKPLDVGAVLAAARETRGIVTVEEGLVGGGLGGSVAEVVVQHAPCRMRLLGFPDTFAPTGAAPWLLDHFGMDPQGIADTALQLV